MTRRRPWISLLPLTALLTGCLAVTVNVTFPQEKIDSAASSIEDLVRTPKQPPADSPPSTPPAPRREGALPWLGRALSPLGPKPAEAQVPDLKIRTPEIMAAIDSRSARYGELAAAMAKGCIGENNQALVEARPGTACPGNAAALVAAENRDRTYIYRTLMEQNNMPPTELPKVQAGFAKANREKAPAGAWTQNPDGQWTRK